MKYTLQKISLLKTSCIVTLMVFTCSYPVIGIMQFFRSFATDDKFPWIILMVVPLIAATLSFFFTAIVCFVYNLAAKMLGGITIDIDKHHP